MNQDPLIKQKASLINLQTLSEAGKKLKIQLSTKSGRCGSLHLAVKAGDRYPLEMQTKLYVLLTLSFVERISRRWICYEHQTTVATPIARLSGELSTKNQ